MAFSIQGEIAHNPTSIRRRIFGRSQESTLSTLNSPSRSKGSPLSSPTALDKDNDSVKSDKDASVGIRQARSRKSVDAKPTDRLSIFGTTFVGTLGKSRKPPPRFDLTIFLFFASFLTCYY